MRIDLYAARKAKAMEKMIQSLSLLPLSGRHQAAVSEALTQRTADMRELLLIEALGGLFHDMVTSPISLPDFTEVDGIGASKAWSLALAGWSSWDQVAGAEPKAFQDIAGMTPELARALIKTAKEKVT